MEGGTIMSGAREGEQDKKGVRGGGDSGRDRERRTRWRREEGGGGGGGGGSRVVRGKKVGSCVAR